MHLFNKGGANLNNKILVVMRAGTPKANARNM